MLNITSLRRRTTGIASRPEVALIAGRDRRELLKHVLGHDVEVVAELESGNRAHLLREVEPDVIFIDASDPDINPLTTRLHLEQTGIHARIVLLTDEPAALAAIGSLDGVLAVHPYDAAGVLAAAQRDTNQPATAPIAA